MASSDEYQHIQFWENIKKEKLFCQEYRAKTEEEINQEFVDDYMKEAKKFYPPKKKIIL